MYSYEDRMRAVQLYIKVGKRIGATIRQLGYPTKNSLKDWYHEYERRHDLPTCYVRTKPWYSPEQKKVAVEHYLSHGRCLAGTRRALGYPCRATLSAWIDGHSPDARRRVVSQAVTTLRSEQQQAGSGDRFVLQAGQCARGGPKGRREPTGVVQLEGSATRPRGPHTHDAP